MPTSKKLDEIQQCAKACHAALVELERFAGIAEAAEKIRSEPPNYFAIYDAAERHSDEQRELEAFEEKSQSGALAATFGIYTFGFQTLTSASD